MSSAYLDALDRVHTRAMAALRPWIEQNAKPDHIDALTPRRPLREVRKSLEATIDDTEVRDLVARAADFADRENVRALTQIPGIDPSKFFSDEGTIAAFRDRNVALVKTLASEYLDDLASTLEGIDARDLHVADLTQLLTDRFDVSRSRAEFWAVDQTLKLNGDITRERMISAGIDEYYWTTSKDERVREFHVHLDGQRFRFSDPPVTNERGDRNNPSRDYRCRCTPYPVIEGAPEAPQVTAEPFDHDPENVLGASVDVLGE